VISVLYAFRVMLVVTLAVAPMAAAESAKPSYGALETAYSALRARDYDRAIASFREAIRLGGGTPGVHKDLAYTLLKTGDNEAARDEFAEAAKLDPSDATAALEFAFLAYETGEQAEARRVFDRIRKTANATAEQAFENIDRPLAEGIRRWQEALRISPDNFSAHQELARLAGQRDELPLAAEQYLAAWRLKPQYRELLVALGRVERAMGKTDDANAALLAASRGASPRAAEQARELLPRRYPFVYEFRRALDLDPSNLRLRRELAYLLLEMKQKAEAELEFDKIHEQDPSDLLSTAQLGFLRLERNDAAEARPLLDAVMAGKDVELANRVRAALKLPLVRESAPVSSHAPAGGSSVEAKLMAKASLDKGYLKDALKYLTLAHEEDPDDYWVMLKLGWVYNMLHQDKEAVQWFRRAKQSSDESIADEASKAYSNIEPATRLIHTTFWAYPFYSSRWGDAFGYAQIKTAMKLGSLPIDVYASTRFVGDALGEIAPTRQIPFPEYLSENSVIFALGMASHPWHGVFGWFEAGESVSYLPSHPNLPAAVPDYRGGVSYAKALGHTIGSHGAFFETNEDAVFVSRFMDDFLVYTQSRAGYSFGGAQLYWNFDVTTDSLRQYWANFADTGPGLRFRVPETPKSMLFSLAMLRGAYTINRYNIWRPNFWDFRAGLWYAFTH
jgi:tetratricopeptide (TPR) repeat protein